MELVQPAAELSFTPPPRFGPRPHTRAALPHLQLDQWPPADIAAELVHRALALPYVRPTQSRMASPESPALSLPDEVAAGPREAFIDGHEFCHLHPLPEGSIHLTLPPDIREAAVRVGWAEAHPTSRLGVLSEAIVLVYAPRSPRELVIVLKLVCSSYRYARGLSRLEPSWCSQAQRVG
jgi:Luciferase